MKDDKKVNSEHGMLNNIFYTVRSVWQYQKFLFVLLLAEVAAGILTPLLNAYLPKLVIDELTRGAAIRHMVLAVGGFTLVMVLVNFIGEYASNAKYMRYNNLRMVFLMRLYRKYLTCDYSFTESSVGQTMYQRAMNATQNGDGSGISRMIPAVVGLATGVLSFVLFSAILSILHPLIAVMLTLTALASYGVMRSARSYEHRTKDERAGADRKLQYLTRQADDIAPAKDIRLYRITALFHSLRDKLIEERTKWEARVQNRHLASLVFQAFTTLLRDGLAYAYLFYAVISRRIGVSDTFFYFAAISGFSGIVMQIVTRFNEISQAQLLLCDMRIYLDHRETPEPDPAAPPPDVASPPEIRFENVCFAYENDGKRVVDNFSLALAAGEKIALVGLNGAGKTTLIKLLCGFYLPDSGRITIGGTDVSALRKEDLMPLFSAVFQDAFILPMTLAENIALCEGDDVDIARVKQCIDLAGLEQLVLRCGKGEDTPIMKMSDEDGMVLSGGEVQKLLMARALYKDAPILVLDEPTAALDPIAESRMYGLYNTFTSGKTAIFISHRLASTRFCDRVAFFQDGQVIELGTHAELVAQNGKYAELFRLQSHYYQEENAV